MTEDATPTTPPADAGTARGQTWMLVSRERGHYIRIDGAKAARGAFHTRREVWLTRPVAAFIRQATDASTVFVDPFAGAGDLLAACERRFGRPGAGFDLHAPGWDRHDSLLEMPAVPGGLVVTNPPFLAKHSARRKGVREAVAHHYERSGRADLYQVALDAALARYRHVVAIVPETFLRSDYPKTHLSCVSVLEDNPFDDTETPVCVACFDTTLRDGERAARVHVGDRFRGTLADLARHRPADTRGARIRFNAPDGMLALRAVDGHAPDDRIAFLPAEGFGYDRARIRVSSRLMTCIALPDLPPARVPELAAHANDVLERMRRRSHDLLLAPFKGNNRAGRRRRRLDYAMARAILEAALRRMGIGRRARGRAGARPGPARPRPL